jgi:[protein-PII] uridylyltransferase
MAVLWHPGADAAIRWNLVAPDRSMLLADDTLTGEAWCDAHTAMVDSWLRELFLTAAGAEAEGVALAAVGGYGRGELCPSSDIDVILLHAKRQHAIATIADRIWYPIWDTGVHLGHSVSTPSQALRLAGDDLDTATAFLTVRYIAGDESLTEALATGAARQWQKGARRWLAQLADSVDARHAGADEVAFTLEPDLKEGRGGLRDAHALTWAEAAWPDLLYDDRQDLAGAYSVLLDARVELQRQTGRATNRLVLEEQSPVATALGDSSSDSLMIRIAEAASMIAWTSDDIWRRVRASLAGPLRRAVSRPRHVGPGITLSDGEVHLDASVNAETNALLPLKVALAAANHEAVIARGTLQRLAKSPPMHECWDAGARYLFVDLLRTGRPAIAVIESLERRGVWEKILPEWAAVRSRPQHNAYHRFTVDRHLLETVAEAAGLAERVSRPDLLVVGALLHDLGKGRDVDHTALGVELAARICERMRFSAEDSELVVALVRHHLLLPEVATRRDLHDPGTIALVASRVGTVDQLELLAALSEADGRATGHGAWTLWKRGLVEDLVEQVALLLNGQHPAEATAGRPPTPEQQAFLARPGRVVEATDDVVTVVADDRPGLFSRTAGVLAVHGLDVLAASAYSGEDGRALSQFKVVDHRRDTIPWPRVVSDLERALDGRLAINPRLAKRAHTYGQGQTHYAQLAVTAVIFDHTASETATVIDVYAPDEVGLLYRITRVMAELDLDIRLAKAETFGGQAVDSFYVRHRDGSKIIEPEILKEIEWAVLHSLTGEVR